MIGYEPWPTDYERVSIINYVWSLCPDRRTMNGSVVYVGCRECSSDQWTRKFSCSINEMKSAYRAWLIWWKWCMIWSYMTLLLWLIWYWWYLTFLSWLTWYRKWMIVKYMYDCYELCDYGRKEDVNCYIWMIGIYIYMYMC